MHGYGMCSAMASSVFNSPVMALCQSKLSSRCPGRTFPRLWSVLVPSAIWQRTTVGVSWLTVRKAPTSMDTMTASSNLPRSRNMLGNSLATMLLEAGLKRQSLSGCIHANSLATQDTHATPQDNHGKTPKPNDNRRARHRQSRSSRPIETNTWRIEGIPFLVASEVSGSSLENCFKGLDTLSQPQFCCNCHKQLGKLVLCGNQRDHGFQLVGGSSDLVFGGVIWMCRFRDRRTPQLFCRSRFRIVLIIRGVSFFIREGIFDCVPYPFGSKLELWSL